jgi:hypothetical protein
MLEQQKAVPPAPGRARQSAQGGRRVWRLAKLHKLFRMIRQQAVGPGCGAARFGGCVPRLPAGCAVGSNGDGGSQTARTVNPVGMVYSQVILPD